MGVGGEVGDVGVHVHKRVEFGGVGQTDFDNPVGHRVLVDETGIFLKSLVYFDYFAAGGNYQVGGGLHALDGAEIVAFGEFFPDFGHIDIYNVAKGFLGVLGDADVAVAFAVDGKILMGGGVVGYHCYIY